MRADVIFNAVGFKSPAQAPCPVFLFQNIDFGNIFPICRKQAKEMADRPPPRIVSFMSLSFLQMGMKLNSLMIVLCCLRVILYNGRIPPSKAREDKDCSFILTRGKMPQSFIQRTFSISF